MYARGSRRVTAEQPTGVRPSLVDPACPPDVRRTAERIATQLKGIPTLESSIAIPDNAANAVPHLLIRYDQARVKISPGAVMTELRRGNPSIELNPATGKVRQAGLPSDQNTIVVGVWMLQPGEEAIVARRLREVLLNAAAA